MNTILILYPNEFNCSSKFERKVGQIIKNIDNAQIVYLQDKNNLINSFFKEKDKFQIKEIKSLSDAKITHAVIFDDGEVFPREKNQIEQKGIPLRFIKTPITRVVNIKIEEKYKGLKSTESYEYIGRGSYWGNPYSMYEAGEDEDSNSREEVIRKFKYDFDFDKFPNKNKSDVYKLAGKRLGCFCKPLCCHGDVLADFLNKWDDGK